MRNFHYCNYYWLILTLIVCCYSAAYADPQEPTAIYQQYLKDLAVKPVEYLLENYWSSEVETHAKALLADSSSQNRAQRESFNLFVKFPLKMHAIFFMEQVLRKDSACLLVTGQADNFQSVAFNIRYLLENDAWRIHAVTVKHYDKKQLMPTTPNCDPNEH